MAEVSAVGSGVILAEVKWNQQSESTGYNIMLRIFASLKLFPPGSGYMTQPSGYWNMNMFITTKAICIDGDRTDWTDGLN